MKKLLILILSVCILLSFAGCSGLENILGGDLGGGQNGIDNGAQNVRRGDQGKQEGLLQKDHAVVQRQHNVHDRRDCRPEKAGVIVLEPLTGKIGHDTANEVCRKRIACHTDTHHGHDEITAQKKSKAHGTRPLSLYFFVFFILLPYWLRSTAYIFFPSRRDKDRFDRPWQPRGEAY